MRVKRVFRLITSTCHRPLCSELASEVVLISDVESDDYSESARSYELGKASDFACARPRPDFSAFLCLWRKLTIGWEMRPVRLVLQNIRNFFSQNGWCLPFTKNSRSCKGSNKAESAGAKGQRKAWRAAFHDLYGCPPTFNITAVVDEPYTTAAVQCCAVV